VTISQLIDKPSPVPSPVGLVVKNGWNSLSRNSGAIPMPLSRTRISTASPKSRVATFSFGLKLGSPVSRQRLHGGTIAVDSKVSEFTEFTIRLPRSSRQATMAGASHERQHLDRR
jgi:hypothetical protein